MIAKLAKEAVVEIETKGLRVNLADAAWQKSSGAARTS